MTSDFRAVPATNGAREHAAGPASEQPGCQPAGKRRAGRAAPATERVIQFQECSTPYGAIYLAATETGLCRITVPGQTLAELDRWLTHRLPWATLAPAVGALDRQSTAITAYFDGDPLPELAIELFGTPFQVAVWRAVLAVPYGETRSYAAIAREIGHPLASRAVGAANAANPLSFVIPCHRIIGADGTIKGYPGGVITRRMLLELERER